MSEEGEPATGRSRVDWTRWSTIVSTASAGVGLLLTAVVTWFGVLTAQDQLSQAQEQATEAEKRQASMVATWTVRGGQGRLLQVVANRSEDPVLGAVLRIPRNTDWTHHPKAKPEYASFLVGQIPPCTSVLVEPNMGWFETVVFDFIDSSGRAWHRESSGTLVKGHLAQVGVDQPVPPVWKTQKLDSCGTD